MSRATWKISDFLFPLHFYPATLIQAFISLCDSCNGLLTHRALVISPWAIHVVHYDHPPHIHSPQIPIILLFVIQQPLRITFLTKPKHAFFSTIKELQLVRSSLSFPLHLFFNWTNIY